LLEVDPLASAVVDTIDLRPDNDVLVAIDARVAQDTAVWRLTALDPTTRLPITDPDRGLLPPNLIPPEGDGAVSFVVDPVSGLATGDPILNTASIRFDANPIIVTNTVQRTIDADAPESAVQPLPAYVSDTTIVLDVTSADAESGPINHSVFVSEDDGPFVPVILATSSGSVSFTGRFGHRYAFYSQGADTVGNAEPVPACPMP
jgi:hypothetical protein